MTDTVARLFRPDPANPGGISTLRLHLLRLVFAGTFLFVGAGAWKAILTHGGPWDPLHGVAFSPLVFTPARRLSCRPDGNHLPLRAGRGSRGGALALRVEKLFLEGNRGPAGKLELCVVVEPTTRRRSRSMPRVSSTRPKRQGRSAFRLRRPLCQGRNTRTGPRLLV